MSEKRFTFSTKWRWILFDNETEKFMDMEDCKDKLNEQQDTISQLEQENANRLGDKIRSLDEFEKCTNKLKKKILEQQATINKQDDEIKKLKRTERSWRKIHCCNKESNNCGIVIEQQNIISRLETQLQKIPPKIRELWIGED